MSKIYKIKLLKTLWGLLKTYNIMDEAIKITLTAYMTDLLCQQLGEHDPAKAPELAEKYQQSILEAVQDIAHTCKRTIIGIIAQHNQ